MRSWPTVAGPSAANRVNNEPEQGARSILQLALELEHQLENAPSSLLMLLCYACFC